MTTSAFSAKASVTGEGRSQGVGSAPAQLPAFTAGRAGWTPGGVVGILGRAPWAARREPVIHRSEKGDQMRRQVRAALGTVLAIGLTLGASVAPTAARTTGRQSIKGTIVATGAGAKRTVVSSVIFATGAFTGVGRDVEVASRPGDPQNVNRDDLVFARGAIHIVNTSQA